MRYSRKNLYGTFYDYPRILITLYLNPVGNLIADCQPSVVASDDQPVPALLDDLNGTAFFNIHVSHRFQNLRNAKHPFDRTGIACICL